MQHIVKYRNINIVNYKCGRFMTIHSKFVHSSIHSFINTLIHTVIYSKPLKLILRSKDYKYPKTWTLNSRVLNKILFCELNGCVYTRQQPIKHRNPHRIYKLNKGHATGIQLCSYVHKTGVISIAFVYKFWNFFFFIFKNSPS